MELVIIKPDSPTWDSMWEWLAAHPINEGIAIPELAEHQGEVWQYMGSFKKTGIVIHQFRHRQHPATNMRYELSWENPEPVPDEDIEKISKIK